MPAPAFDNFVSKFKEGTKQAADKIGRQAKIAKLKMEIMTLTGEKSRHFQTIGERTYLLYKESNQFTSSTLNDRVKSEFLQIERIETRIQDLERQIEDLQAGGPDPEVTDASEVNEVTDRP